MPHLTVAQNIFIGREPRGPAAPVRAGAQPGRPPTCPPAGPPPRRARARGRHLTVAKQQMVEIAKALSYDARGADHGRAHRRPQRRGGRGAARPDPPVRAPRTPASSTSRTGWTSSSRSPTGSRSSATAAMSRPLDTAATTMKEVVSLMVAAHDHERGEAGRRARRPRGRASASRDLCTKDAAQGRVLRPPRRRDPRLRRADGRRPHRGGPGAGRRRPSQRRA